VRDKELAADSYRQGVGIAQQATEIERLERIRKLDLFEGYGDSREGEWAVDEFLQEREKIAYIAHCQYGKATFTRYS